VVISLGFSAYFLFAYGQADATVIP